MMHKPVSRQTIVLTGASSGIGLVTARMAASRGAALVLVARNRAALDTLAGEIRAGGGRAIAVAADVGEAGAVEAVAAAATEAFGGFDTWINNAAVSIFGRIREVELDDMRRLFDTNFWGVVHGSRTALEHFRRRGGGKLINIGSVLGERAIPVQGVYSASKHAVAGITEALRMEVAAERLPVSVVLIKPASIDTPYLHHAKNYMSVAPMHPPPVYDPAVVARAILHACEHETRDLVVGGAGRLVTAIAGAAPRATDLVMARLGPLLQRRRAPAGPIERNALHTPGEGLSERSGEPRFTFKHSAYTALQGLPQAGLGAALALASIAAVALGEGLRRRAAARAGPHAPRARGTRGTGQSAAPSATSAAPTAAPARP